MDDSTMKEEDGVATKNIKKKPQFTKTTRTLLNAILRWNYEALHRTLS